MSGIVNTGAKTVPEAPESNENVPCGFSNGVMRKVFRNSFKDAVAGEWRVRRGVPILPPLKCEMLC